jgi:hypothetical protein
MKGFCVLAVLVEAALMFPGSIGAQAQEPESGFVVLSLPATGWGVGLALRDFVISESATRPDGKARVIRAERAAAAMMLTGFIVPAPAGDSASACRDAFWQRLQTSPAARDYRDVRLAQADGMASVEYVIAEILGVRFDQRHVHAYLGKDDSCIEIHLSKTLFEPKDQELFDTVLRALRLIEASAMPTVATARNYRISIGEAVELTMPASWQEEFPGGPGNAGPTLSLVPSNDKQVLSLLTVLVPETERRDSSYNAPDQLRKRAEAAGRRLLEKTIEDKLSPEEIIGPEVFGFMFTVTDKDPGSGPWDFRHVTHVEAGLHDVALSFSLFFQSPGVPDRATALEVFKNTRLIALQPSR